MTNKEAQARIKINKLLEQAGWRLLDSVVAKANVCLEASTNIQKHDIDTLGNDFEKVSTGFIDFLLYDDNKKPICILEAKSEKKDPLDGKEQARTYALSQKAPYIILSNGNIHYFWEIASGNPIKISSFPTLQSLEKKYSLEKDRKKLAKEIISKDYLAKIKEPNYATNPLYINTKTQLQYLEDKKLRFLREYQIKAIKALQKSVAEGKNRFLFEMATGTGKTFLAAAIINLYIKTGNANRILFLVDRLELEDQANKNFINYLSKDCTVKIFKENKDDWKNAEILISTIQSISYNDKYKKLFSPTDFDLIISDEAHRSVSGNSRVIFEYFIGDKLGLTATPKDYLKNLTPETISQEDPREYERRVLLSTYKIFGCESGEPTYRYSLQNGADEGFLILPSAKDCRTNITTKLLAEEGYSVKRELSGQEEEEVFKQTDFEKKYFNDSTNAQFVKTFMANALRDPLSGEIGKTIVFCVSQNHAQKITQLLNEYASLMFNKQRKEIVYNSDFAVQVTSRIPEAQQMTKSFANNNLNGHTRFLEGYTSSKTRVCVTVGMMSTGYDCPDLLNVCLMRPIFSPTDFVQIKGRGTRKETFCYDTNNNKQIKRKKKSFFLFDFFGNCEYFEKGFKYDAVIPLPKENKTKLAELLPGTPPPLSSSDSKFVDGTPDAMMPIQDFQSISKNWRVDTELYSNKFESLVKENKTIVKAMEDGNIQIAIAAMQEDIFDKPEEFFNTKNLTEHYAADRPLQPLELIEKGLGKIQKFKTREELLCSDTDKIKLLIDIPFDKYNEFEFFCQTYLDNPEAREAIKSKTYTTYFGADPEALKMLKILGKDILNALPQIIEDNIDLKRY